jgi:hypothetical protein
MLLNMQAALYSEFLINLFFIRSFIPMFFHFILIAAVLSHRIVLKILRDMTSGKRQPSNHDQSAQPTVQAGHFDPGADTLGHFLYMRDHADLPPQGLQAVQGVHRHTQGIRVEAPETFVYEQRLDAHTVRGQ